MAMKKNKISLNNLFGNLANLVTLLNLLSGFLSLVLSSQGRFYSAGWILILAMVWDSLDGNIARMFKNVTQFGRELDSLADMVSFVVAPAFLAVSFLAESVNPMVLFLIFLYLGGGAFRLARFNVGAPVKGCFQGLPTPAAAVVLTMATLVSIKHGDAVSISHFVLPFLLMALGGLMVSHVPYPKFTGMQFAKWKHLLYGSLGIFVLISFTLGLEHAVFILGFIYAALTPAMVWPMRSAFFTPAEDEARA